MIREWKEIEVKDRVIVPFDWKDRTLGGSNLGRAEFSICTKFRRGMLSEFWIYPAQLRMDTYWHWVGEYDDFTINSYEDLPMAGAWYFGYCKDHKTTVFHVYAPTGAKYFEISYRGLSFWKTNIYSPKGV